jgi:soluble lytic murein transglycosylase-like protein
MTELILSCLLNVSATYNIRPRIIMAVIKVESNWDHKAVNNNEDFGLMQVRAKYVEETGKELLDPCINLERGTKILANARDNCKHTDELEWVVCFNLGITGGSKIKHPKLFPYYKKVKKALSYYDKKTETKKENKKQKRSIAKTKY